MFSVKLSLYGELFFYESLEEIKEEISEYIEEILLGTN